MTAGRDRKMDPAAHEIAGSFAPTRPPTSRPPPKAPDAKRPARSAGPAGDEPDEIAGRPSYTTRHDVESLGVSLGPALHEACGDRLGDIEWFQSAWQHSGAATGRTSWRLHSGEVVDAIAKVPVSYSEFFWTSRLGAVDPMWYESEECRHLPVPRVLACGMELGGYDIAWLVLEKVSGRPVSKQMDAESLDRLFEATALFHKMAEAVKPVAQGRRRSMPDWEATLARGAEACRDNDIADSNRWLAAIARVRGVLDRLIDTWDSRQTDTWCHGDLHPGNVIIRCDRTCPEDNCAVLIDLGLVHLGHWVEDAVYLERLHWGREEKLAGIDPVASLAGHRRALGLHADETDARLADVRRVLMGATSPAYLGHESNPRYLASALEHVERLLPGFGG